MRQRGCSGRIILVLISGGECLQLLKFLFSQVLLRCDFIFAYSCVKHCRKEEEAAEGEGQERVILAAFTQPKLGDDIWIL